MGALCVATAASAQHAYNNAEISSTADLIGTSRYVSMGGALGALGADISAISSNPAAIGLYRKSDVALTAGVLWPKDKKYDEGDALVHGTFDQIGFVASWNVQGDRVKFFNFAFNYQKKANFNRAFYADNANPRGLSQMDQVAKQANTYYNYFGAMDDAYGLIKNSWESWLLDYGPRPSNPTDSAFQNAYDASENKYTHYSTGSAQAFDLNMSFNVDDRWYVGGTLGFENVDYERHSMYTEYRDATDPADPFYGFIQDYSIYNDQRISGFGINFKLGAIVRPIEDNPFRVGLAVETPTWYRLKSRTDHSIDSKYDNNGTHLDYYDASGNYVNGGYYNVPGRDDCYLEYVLRTPWRARVSLGSTVDRYLAWGVEYEYANYGKNRLSYPDDADYYGGNSFSGQSDKEMTRLTNRNFKGQHTVKAGVEFKLSSDWSARLGYNYISSIYKSGKTFNQNINSAVLDYIPNTSYMTLSDANILACGLGYKYKHFYCDLTYKFRQQNGEFYAFDDSFTSDAQFATDYPALAGRKLSPVDLNLNRHTITCTLGFKF